MLQRVVDLDDVVSRKSGVVSEGAREQLLVLDLSTGNYFDAGSVGGFIWQRLDGERSLQAVAEEVQRHFEVEMAVAQRDLLEFVAQLEAAGLIVRNRA